jgi:hypothetical protein
MFFFFFVAILYMCSINQQVLTMTKSEQFAIDEWLYDYPKTATFDDILYMLLDGNDTSIVCYPQGESMSKRDLANCISGTQTHFAFVVGE